MNAEQAGRALEALLAETQIAAAPGVLDHR
jgi:hypothetical protein